LSSFLDDQLPINRHNFTAILPGWSGICVCVGDSDLVSISIIKSNKSI
jgi:hypothetical protein